MAKYGSQSVTITVDEAKPPDFNRIAQDILRLNDDPAGLRDAIAEQLRQVWNARGAADIAKLAETYRFESPIDTNVIRELDR